MSKLVDKIGSILFPCDHLWTNGPDFTLAADKEGGVPWLVATPRFCLKCHELTFKGKKIELTKPQGENS